MPGVLIVKKSGIYAIWKLEQKAIDGNLLCRFGLWRLWLRKTIFKCQYICSVDVVGRKTDPI